MSLIIPTTTILRDEIIADLQTALNQSIPLLPKAFNRVIAKVLAGMLLTLYHVASFFFLQIFIQTATEKEITINNNKIVPLTFWGRLVGAGDPYPATAAEITVTITVKMTGTILEAGKIKVVSSENNITYQLKENVALVSATVEGIFQAVAGTDENFSGLGTIGNLPAGSLVSFTQPISEVLPDAIVSALSLPGTEAEAAEKYRLRVLQHFQNRPQGGAPLDYVYWCKENLSAVLNAYVYRESPAGVQIYIEVEETPSTPDGIPTSAQLTEITDFINETESGKALRRPLSDLVTVSGITRRAFEIDIIDLESEFLTELKEKLEEVCSDYFQKRENNIVGVTSQPAHQSVRSDDVRGIINDYVTAYNSSFSAVRVKFLSGLVFQTYDLKKGEKAKLEIINYLTS